MKKIAIFALFLFACGEATIEKCHCPVTASDALPIQFWPQNCDSYNTQEKCGVHDVCFCAPVNCDDPIYLQFTDEDGGDAIFVVAEEDGNDLYTELLPSEEIDGATVYSTTFIASDRFPCSDRKVSMNVLKNSFPEIDSGSFQNIDISGVNWSLNGNSAEATINTAGTSFTNSWTATIEQGISIPPGQLIRVQADLLLGTGALTVNAYIRGYDASGNLVFRQLGLFLAIAGPQLVIATFRVGIAGPGQDVYLENTSITRIGIDVVRISGSGSEDLVLTNIEVLVPVLYTDCIHLSESHSCTKLIEYYNARNFAGLIYEDQSPDITFYARFPIVFFHEREVEEDESIELPNSVLSLNTQTKTQRQLSTSLMPHYMHRKLLLVLQHQNVIIDGKTWVKEDPYERLDSDRRWPLRKATCWLTDKNSVQRNIL